MFALLLRSCASRLVDAPTIVTIVDRVGFACGGLSGGYLRSSLVECTPDEIGEMTHYFMWKREKNNIPLYMVSDKGWAAKGTTEAGKRRGRKVKRRIMAPGSPLHATSPGVVCCFFFCPHRIQLWKLSLLLSASHTAPEAQQISPTGRRCLGHPGDSCEDCLPT